MVGFSAADVLFAAGAAAPVQYRAFNQSVSAGAVISTAGTKKMFGARLDGQVITSSSAHSARACELMCNNNGKCNAWTWVKARPPPPGDDVGGVAAYCQLRNGTQHRVADSCCISGYKQKTPDLACVRYGKISVQQQQENIRRQCGFQSTYGAATVGRPSGQITILWDANYGVHTRWCSTGTNRTLTTTVLQRRQSMLSRCVQKVSVPYLFRKTQAVASTMLFNSRLKPGTIQWESSKLPYGTVIRQDPRGGSRVTIGSRVNIWLAKAVQVRVPDLRGQLEQQARIRLDNVGLKSGRSMQQESDRPDNEVLEQKPLAGTLAKSGDVVRLVISRQMVRVPNLIGRKREQAIEMLRGIQLTDLVTKQESEKISGIVLSQQPPANMRVRVGSAIQISISEQVVNVPNLLGIQQVEAKKLLRQYQLKAGRVTTRNSGKASGIVLSQQPPANKRVHIGSAVHFSISEQVVPVPGLIKLGEKEAVNQLHSAGLSLGSMTTQIVNDRDDEVLKQSPDAGTMVRIGTPVNIVVAAWAMVPVPELTGLDVEHTKSILVQHGLVLGALGSEKSEHTEGIVIRQFPKHGKKVKTGSPVDVTVSEQVIAVPDLSGLTEDQARALLMKRGLQAGEIRKQFSWQEKGRVIEGEQNPARYQRVKPGTAVDFVLAAYNTLLLVSAGTLLGLLVVGGAYSVQARRARSASGGSAPVVRVRPHQDSGVSQITSEGQKITGHEIQFKPVVDQGEQRLMTDTDNKTAGDKK